MEERQSRAELCAARTEKGERNLEKRRRERQKQNRSRRAAPRRGCAVLYPVINRTAQLRAVPSRERSYPGRSGKDANPTVPELGKKRRAAGTKRKTPRPERSTVLSRERS